MAAANFPAELGDELVFEGGHINNPNDPGGDTDWGITLATLSHFLGRPATDADLVSMTWATKQAIYRTMFWNLINGDNLPSGIDLEMFDMAVNGGPYGAATKLQTLLGVYADGAIGPKTLAAMAAMDPATLIRDYAAVRTAYYKRLPGFADFGDGWLSRVNKCESEALALIGVTT